VTGIRNLRGAKDERRQGDALVLHCLAVIRAAQDTEPPAEYLAQLLAQTDVAVHLPRTGPRTVSRASTRVAPIMAFQDFARLLCGL
jgi:hypothetical protein